MGIPCSPAGHSHCSVLQCVAGAMYITGFAESIADVLSLSNIWAVRGISLAVLLGLLGINLAGVKWIIRIQLLLLFLLAVSTLDFVIGSFTHLDPGKNGGSSHWGQEVLIPCGFLLRHLCEVTHLGRGRVQHFQMCPLSFGTDLLEATHNFARSKYFQSMTEHLFNLGNRALNVCACYTCIALGGFLTAESSGVCSCSL